MRSRTARAFACVFGLTACLAWAGEGAREDEARALAKRVADAAPSGAFVADLTLVTSGDLSRRLTMSGASLHDGGTARYIEVVAPTNLKDTRYLLLERPSGAARQFFYLPTMQRVMRLSEAARREPFLGSTFYIADLIPPALDDFAYAFVGDATVQDRACRLVEATPVDPDEAVYGRSVLAIDPTDLVVLRPEFFDADDRPLKVLHVDVLERREGRWTAVRQRMVNVPADETSSLVVEDIDYDAALPDEIFTVGHLGR